MQFMINFVHASVQQTWANKIIYYALLTFGTERGPSIDAFQCIAVIYKVSIIINYYILPCHARWNQPPCS